MVKTFKVIVIFSFGLFCLYILESACFRLVEGYANWRHNLAWGDIKTPAFHSALKKLPLDHFVTRPTDFDAPKHLGYWVSEENNYASRVLSFTRPLRDIYKNHVESKNDALVNYEIRDYGAVKGVVLPGLKKAATIENVRNRRARRVGDKMEFARGLFIKIILDENDDSFSSEFSKLEASFGFLLERGFACAVLPVFSVDDLISNIDNLKKRETLLTENLFIWADGEAGDIIQKACKIEPDFWSAIMITDPMEFISPPENVALPWVYFQIEDNRKLKEEGLEHLYNWIYLARSTNNLYSSRLGGMLKTSHSLYVNDDIPSNFVAYVLQCTDFREQMALVEKESEIVFAPKPKLENKINNDLPKPIAVNEKMEAIEGTFNLKRIEESIERIEDEEDINVNLISAEFNCDIINAYREINANDSKLKLISNRDLILKLGLGFEQMGADVLEQIRIRDPLFHRYYKSLQAIEDSPLN